MNEFRFICARLILYKRVLKILSVTERHTVEIELRIQISLAGVHGAFVSCYLCNKMFFFHIVKIYLKLISQNLYHLTIAHFIDNIFSTFSTFVAI